MSEKPRPSPYRTRAARGRLALLSSIESPELIGLVLDNRQLLKPKIVAALVSYDAKLRKEFDASHEHFKAEAVAAAQVATLDAADSALLHALSMTSNARPWMRREGFISAAQIITDLLSETRAALRAKDFGHIAEILERRH